ncbi:putative quinone-oxidoreductase like protein, chloroplastic [Balamuthia mandrillaris]
MKAVVYDSYSDKPGEILRYRTDCAPPPRPPPSGEITVRVHATSVNPVDWKFASGFNAFAQRLFSRGSGVFPFIPCFDLSGVIVEIGQGCSSKFKVGDEVFAMAHWSRCGACAEYVNIAEKLVAYKPKGLSHDEAASLPLVSLTSYQALRLAKVEGKTGAKVLVLGGSGGTGSVGVQIAKHWGCYVAATCSGRNAQFVSGLGADQIIDYTQENWWESLAGQDFDAVYDCLGGVEVWIRSHGVLKKGGMFVTIVGDNQQAITPKYLASVVGYSANRKFWSLFGSPGYDQHSCVASGKDLTAIARIVEEGGLRPCIEKTYAMQDAVQAFEASQTGRTRGKLVIRILDKEEEQDQAEETESNGRTNEATEEEEESKGKEKNEN